jgi:hypothetical protein
MLSCCVGIFFSCYPFFYFFHYHSYYSRFQALQYFMCQPVACISNIKWQSEMKNKKVSLFIHYMLYVYIPTISFPLSSICSLVLLNFYFILLYSYFFFLPCYTKSLRISTEILQLWLVSSRSFCDFIIPL